MTKESYFLLFISLGVFPVALGYGINPKEVLPAAGITFSFLKEKS